MRVFGISFMLIDCERDYAEEWNRWYDLDHIPEFLGLPGVAAAQRYVATPELIDARAPSGLADLPPGTGRYCTVVMVGPDADASADGRAGMAATHDRLLDVDGRMPDWNRITPRYIEGFDLIGASAGSGVPVATDALPHLRHRGVLAELHGTSDSSVPALLDEQGVLAALQFVASSLPAVEAPWESDQSAALAPHSTRLDLYLLDRDPADLAPQLRRRSDESSAKHRLFHGTFRTIDALRYDVGGLQ